MPMKMIAASHRRPGLSRAEYRRYLEHYHGTVAREEPKTINCYTQYHVLDGAFGLITDDSHHNPIADRDGVVELQFDTLADLLIALGTDEGNSRASRDGKYFADEPNNITTMAEEYDVPVPHPLPAFNPGLGEPGQGGLRVVQYLMRKPEVFWSDFSALWHAAHAHALTKSAYAQNNFRRTTLNLRSRANDNDAAAREHFKMVDPPVYDAIVVFTLDTIEHAGAFRQYFEELVETANDFIDFSQSFYLYANPVRVIDNVDV